MAANILDRIQYFEHFNPSTAGGLVPLCRFFKGNLDFILVWQNYWK
jgi:hypothetical protein